jgi:hypothetical protein
MLKVKMWCKVISVGGWCGWWALLNGGGGGADGIDVEFCYL